MELFLFIIILYVIIFLYFGLPAKLKSSRNGTSVSWKDSIAMRIRKTDDISVFKAHGLAIEKNLDLSLQILEVQYLAGGDPLWVVEQLLKYQSEPSINFKSVSTIDLAAKDKDAHIEKYIKAQKEDK